MVIETSKKEYKKKKERIRPRGSKFIMLRNKKRKEKEKL